MTTLNNKNDEWFSNLMKLLSDSKSKISRKRYITNMKKDGTWGTRIEIIIFCLIYKCELLIGHSAEKGTFKFDSTTDAIKLVNNEICFKNLELIPGLVGHIGSVNNRNPFAKQQVRRNHFIYLKDDEENLSHFGNKRRDTSETILKRIIKVQIMKETYF